MTVGLGIVGFLPSIPNKDQDAVTILLLYSKHISRSYDRRLFISTVIYCKESTRHKRKRKGILQVVLLYHESIAKRSYTSLEGPWVAQSFCVENRALFLALEKLLYNMDKAIATPTILGRITRAVRPHLETSLLSSSCIISNEEDINWKAKIDTNRKRLFDLSTRIV